MVNWLMEGDCLQMMDKIESGSVDLILADPPYGTTACKWDTLIPLDEMWKQLNRVIKPNGAICLTAQTPFDKLLGFSNIQKLKYEWIWEKTSATGHLNAKKMPMKAHENILVFYDKLPVYNPQVTQGHHPTNSFNKSSTFDGECYGKVKGNSGGGKTSRYPRSVLVFKSDKQKSSLHPTQKPVALMDYLIKSYTNAGNIVLDFCMGSGTTGVSALGLNRGFIGIELDNKYFNIAKERINSSWSK